MSASDLIENNLEQLHSLLCCCHEDDGLVLQGASPEHLDNLLWLAASVVRQTQALFQKVVRPQRLMHRTAAFTERSGSILWTGLRARPEENTVRQCRAMRQVTRSGPGAPSAR